jgi:hypothetical protein
MTTETLAMDASGAVAAADDAIRRARRTVEDLHDTVTSAMRVLYDAEIDSAKARLSDRGNFYLEAAAEHLSRLQTRCTDMRVLTGELTDHLDKAARVVEQANNMTNDLRRSTDPQIAQEASHLSPRIAVLAEIVDLARPVADLAAKHVEKAREASPDVTAPSMLDPRSLEHSIRSAGQELGRADEDLRLLETVVERAAISAHQSGRVANEISDTARRRISGEHDSWSPGGSTDVQLPLARPSR